MRLPSGLNATLYTAPVWPVSGCADGLAGVGVPQPHRVVVAAGGDARAVGAERHTAHRVGVAGQRLRRRAGRCPRPTAAPCRRQLPEAMRLPSGLNATLDTESVWPVSGWPIGWPVSASHSRTVLSALPEAMRVPSGLNATLVHRVGVAGQRLRRRVGRCRRPTAARVLSSLPEAMRRPSGLNATLDHRVGVAGQRRADGLAGVRVPHPHRVVAAAGDDPRAVRAERHTGHRVGVAGQRLRRSVGRCRRPTAAPSRRSCRRRCACRRG